MVKTGLEKSVFELVYRYKISISDNNNFISEHTIESISHEFGSHRIQVV